MKDFIQRVSKSPWILVYIGIVFVIGWVSIKGVLPAYKSPDSRLYASSFGYPAMLRRLGQPIPVDVISPESRSFDRMISGVGKMTYYHRVPVRFPEVGVVTQVVKEKGDKVKRGEILFQLHPGGYTAKIAQLDLKLKKTELSKTEKDYLREKRAFEEGVTSLTDFDAYKINYQKALVEYRKAEESYYGSLLSLSSRVNRANRDQWQTKKVDDQSDMERKKEGTSLSEELNEQGILSIVSTLEGTLAEFSVVEGQVLMNGVRGEMVVIGDRLLFAGRFDQRYYSKLALGDKALIRLEAFQGITLDASIEHIDHHVQQGRQNIKTVTAWFTIHTQDDSRRLNKIIEGMNGFVEIVRSEEKIAIPESALL